MSDTTYEVFQHYGTAAERAAFTPDPAAGIRPLYIWFETDTGQTWLYHTEWAQITGSGTGGGGGTNTLSYLVQGGNIAQVSGYVFDVAAATYYILGIQYNSPQTQITLDAADADPRIDVVAVNASNAVVVIKGTAAANPSEPTVDPATQLKLGFILVPASAAPSATNTILYAENAGDPTEWDWSTSGSGFVLDSITNPHGGTTDIEATNLPANSYVQGEKGSGSFDPHSADILCFYVRSKLSWGNAKALVITLRLNDVLVGSAVTIARSGTYGFNSATLGSYQLIAIPISAFAIPAGNLINQVRITGTGTGTVQGFYLDDIFFQVNGATNPVDGGITFAEADARYLQRASNLSDLTSGTTATAQLVNFVGDAGAGGVKGLVPAPAAGDAAAGRYLNADGSWDVPPGSAAGDVVGPAGAEADNVVLFDGATGKLVKDSGKTIAEIISDAGAGDVTGPAGAEDHNVPQFNGITGKVLEDSGYTVAEIVAAGAAAAPQGDVVGPAGATNGHVATFNGATGKLLQDGGVLPTGDVTAASNIDDNHIVRGDGGAKGVQQTGITIDDNDNVSGVGTLEIEKLHIIPSNHAAAGATETIDFAVSNEHTVILDENVTLTLSNPEDGGRYTIILIQDASGTNTVTWPNSVKWPAGTPPTITPGANRADLVTLYYYGAMSYYLASINQDYNVS